MRNSTSENNNSCETLGIVSNGLVPQMKVSLALNQRKIYLYDYVSDNSIFECIYYLNKLTDMDRLTGEKRPIEILINSNGGEIYEGLALIGEIEKLKEQGYKVIITNISKAFSMGFLISICGSERYASRYSTYLYHDVSGGCAGSYQTIKEDLDEISRLRGILNGIICKYTNLGIDQLNYWTERKQDKIFTAEQAIELNIADKII